MSDHKGSDDDSAKEDSQEVGLTAPGSSARARSPSPSPSFANAVEYKMATQMSRVAILKYMLEQSSNLTCANTTLEEVDGRTKILNNTWEVFDSAHEQLGTLSKRSVLSHPYIVNNLYGKAFRHYSDYHAKLMQLKAQLRRQEMDQTLASSSYSSTGAPTHSKAKLPEITLPQFEGDFAKWPAFRDLFESLVIDNKEISNIERLHYLKTSVKGSAAELIANSPMSSDSFATSWKVLTDRFNDKHRLIMSYLDKLFSNMTPVKKTAHDLDMLVSNMTQTVDALTALEVPTSSWDYVLIYVLTHRLNPALREAWEVRRGSLPTPTTFDQLINFIKARARALEAVEPASSVSSHSTTTTQRSNQHSKSTHHVSTQPSTSAQYPCDHCRGNHYIVTCPKFRELTPAERHKVVLTQKLCFNCFGHHNLTACNSTRTCKLCGRKHHTMIHLQGVTQGSSSASTHSAQSTQ